MTEPNNNGEIDGEWQRRSYLGVVGAGLLALRRPGRATTAPGAAETAQEGASLEEQYSNVYWGDTASLGDGEVRTFFATDEADEPAAIGIWFTAGTLTGLPDEHTETILSFPEEAGSTQFTFFMLNWNPHGHEPPGIYDLPHFDMHFYFVDEGPSHLDQIEAGSCDDAPVPVAVTCETFDRATRPLPADQQPPDYRDFGGVVPRMGNNLTDPTGLEFAGTTFTHTLIWGAFDGQLTFVEPMITKAFFEGLDDEVQIPVKMPEAFPEAGPYPTRYTMTALPDDDAYAVAFECFEQFPGSENQ